MDLIKQGGPTQAGDLIELPRSSLSEDTLHWISNCLDYLLLLSSSKHCRLNFQMKCQINFLSEKTTLDHKFNSPVILFFFCQVRFL